VRTKFEAPRYTRSEFMKGGPQFTNFTLELPTHPLGNFVICDMGHVKIYLCMKFDVSSYTRFKFMKGDQNLQILSPNSQHTPFGGILLSVRWDMSGSIGVQN